MFKKLVAALIVLTFIVPVSSAQAAVKPGAKCPKLKATSTVGGVKYTCIKSGSKTVWNKGVKVPVTLKAGICPKPAADDAGTGISIARAKTLISMSEGEAEDCSNLLGWTFRVVERDGEIFAGTFDYRTDRVNVTINKGLIVMVNVG